VEKLDPTTPEELGAEAAFYRAAVRRIYLFIAWIAIVGAIVVGWLYGVRTASGFLLGAGVSAINFHWLHQLAEGLGPQVSKPKRRAALGFVARYGLYGLAGYVIVKYLKANLLAALLGLFVGLLAVVAELVYELIHARA